MRKKNRILTLLIVGDGPDRERLEKISESLSLTGKVIFTGMVNPQDVGIYYQLGDVFVCASTVRHRELLTLKP